MIEYASSIMFYGISGMYNIVNGTPDNSCKLIFINDKTGKVIEEMNSNDAD